LSLLLWAMYPALSSTRYDAVQVACVAIALALTLEK
jgi:hypothetical protein